MGSAWKLIFAKTEKKRDPKGHGGNFARRLVQRTAKGVSFVYAILPKPQIRRKSRLQLPQTSLQRKINPRRLSIWPHLRLDFASSKTERLQTIQQNPFEQNPKERKYRPCSFQLWVSVQVRFWFLRRLAQAKKSPKRGEESRDSRLSC